MIKLKNVSKFYYQKGVISSGFSKVNLNFDMGEFVAITGESGSGKSTLLNVISGLDTYEEGEMYVNGLETSHYTEKDFEEYRKKYIGNIFQSFNLINSYTVYQNVELVLLLNGVKRRVAKKKALELIEKVGLIKYKNTKASKLSGGQKQRVSIARALAKDTPIIVADEPTGNLDSESATGIFKLLSEISKDKLVIIVTHNYDQVEEYVTRKITMHDGKVVEDYSIKEVETRETVDESNLIIKEANIFTKLRLGFRNAFNIPVKWILLSIVFIFVSIALISEYASLEESKYQEDISGYNWYFNNSSENRLILKHMVDGVAVPFTEEDVNSISKIDNVEYVIEQDLLVDSRVTLADANYDVYLYGNLLDISMYEGSHELTCGTFPENPNEVLLVATEDNYYIWYELEDIISRDYYTESLSSYDMDWNTVYKITGVIYAEPEDNPFLTQGGIVFYGGTDIYKSALIKTNYDYSTTSVTFQGATHSDEGNMWHIAISDNVEKGTCVVSEDYDMYVEKTYEAKGKTLTVNVKNSYYEDSLDLTVAKTYTEKTMKNYMSISEGDSYSWYMGYIFINPDDYYSLFTKDTYQMSVFVEDAHIVNETADTLKNMGYKVFVMKDSLYVYDGSAILQLLSNIFMVLLAIVLLFVAYFVIRIILKSRNVYYSTIRMIGSSMSTSRALLMVELVIDATVSYLITLGLIYYGTIKVPDMSLVSNVNQYMTNESFIVVYGILFIISILISLRYARKLFKKSTMNTYREEV